MLTSMETLRSTVVPALLALALAAAIALYLVECAPVRAVVDASGGD